MSQIYLFPNENVGLATVGVRAGDELQEPSVDEAGAELVSVHGRLARDRLVYLHAVDAVRAVRSPVVDEAAPARVELLSVHDRVVRLERLVDLRVVEGVVDESAAAQVVNA